jgi:hypothetical protein
VTPPRGPETPLTPEELLAHLDADTLDPAAFHHEQHVMTAWAALREPGAQRRVCRGLRSLAERAQRAERYDEELTLGFLRLIDDRRQRAPGLDWEQFRERFPELFSLQAAKSALCELDPPQAEDRPRGKRRRE